MNKQTDKIKGVVGDTINTVDDTMDAVTRGNGVLKYIIIAGLVLLLLAFLGVGVAQNAIDTVGDVTGTVVEGTVDVVGGVVEEVVETTGEVVDEVVGEENPAEQPAEK